jgi:hypothetical protein
MVQQADAQTAIRDAAPAHFLAGGGDEFYRRFTTHNRFT